MGLVKRDKVLIMVLLCGALLVVLNNTLLTPVLPSIMQSLSIEATTVQWLTSGFSLTEAIVIPLSAWLLGRFRTRHLFIGGMLLFLFGSVLAFIAPVFPLLLLGRILQAIAAGVVMPMTFTLIVLIFPREKRGAGMGLVGLVMSFAPAIGPSLGGVLVDTVGWRMIFMITAVLSLIIALLAAKFLTNYEGFKRSKFDVLSVTLSSLGLVSFLYGVSTLTTAEFIAVPLVLIVLGIGLVLLFVRRQTRLEAPMLRLDILKTRKYRTAILSVVLLQSALIATGVVIPLYIQNVLGYSATTSGLVMMPGALLGAVTGLIAGRLFDRYGVRVLALTGSFLIIATGIGLIFFNIDSSIFLVLCVYTLLGLTIQLLVTPINTWGLNSLKNNVIQHANAVTNTLNQVGWSLGTTLVVSFSALPTLFMADAPLLEQTYTGYHFSFIAAACLFFAGACVVILFVRDKKSERVAVKSLVVESSGKRTVRSIMNPDSIVLPEDALVNEAIRAFSGADTSGAPIVDSDKRVVGFISTGDIMKYLGNIESPFTEANTATGIFSFIDNEDFMSRVSGLFELKVTDIATKKVIVTEPNESLEKVCTLLANRKIKKLPVIENGKLVGVISRKNVINALAENLQG